MRARPSYTVGVAACRLSGGCPSRAVVLNPSSVAHDTSSDRVHVRRRTGEMTPGGLRDVAPTRGGAGEVRHSQSGQKEPACPTNPLLDVSDAYRLPCRPCGDDLGQAMKTCAARYRPSDE